MYGVSSDNVNMSDRGFLSRQGFQMKNVFVQVPLPRENFLQMDSSLPEFNGRQDMGDNSEIMHESATLLGSSKSLVPLDPLEQKIMYNMDDNGWDSSFGKRLDMGDGGFGSTLEQSDFSSALQSGSWSALMQSAVAEASNSDTGIQEKCSGLTFQNREQSTNNEASNFMNEERQQTGWAGNNLQSASSNSKSLPMFNDANMKSNFPGFRQSEFQSSIQHYDSNPQRSNPISQQIEPLNIRKRHGLVNIMRTQKVMHDSSEWLHTVILVNSSGDKKTMLMEQCTRREIFRLDDWGAHLIIKGIQKHLMMQFMEAILDPAHPLHLAVQLGLILTMVLFKQVKICLTFFTRLINEGKIAPRRILALLITTHFLRCQRQTLMFNKSSASHGFGLKLAPPSQQGPNSNHFHPAQDSPQIANNIIQDKSMLRQVLKIRGGCLQMSSLKENIGMINLQTLDKEMTPHT